MTELKTLNDLGSNAGLAACPCGKVPTELGITDANQGSKWAFVNGDCCGEWMIEFRTNYAALDSGECKHLAREAWNGAPRAAWMETATAEKKETEIERLRRIEAAARNLVAQKGRYNTQQAYERLASLLGA